MGRGPQQKALVFIPTELLLIIGRSIATHNHVTDKVPFPLRTPLPSPLPKTHVSHNFRTYYAYHHQPMKITEIQKKIKN